MRKDIFLLDRIKELEDQLLNKEEAHKQFKQYIVANISHEIRTPLNAIVGFSGLLKSRDLSIEKRDAYVEHINDNTERLLFLVENIIELSNIQANNMKTNLEICHLSELLKSAFYYVNHLKAKYRKDRVGIICNDECNEKLDKFYTDDHRVLLILKNLLNNALKHTDKGYIEFGCMIKDSLLEFYVKDTGKGIQGKNGSDRSVFKEFYKNEKSYLSGSLGLGIGLSVCEGILNKMNGNIWYNNNKTGGTTFYFTIPFLRSKNEIGRKNKKSAVYIG